MTLYYLGMRNPYLLWRTNTRYEENEFPSILVLDIDKFSEKFDKIELFQWKDLNTQNLDTEDFNIETILTIYDNLRDMIRQNPSDITNYLLYQDNLYEKLYKYVKDYTDAENNIWRRIRRV